MALMVRTRRHIMSGVGWLDGRTSCEWRFSNPSVDANYDVHTQLHGTRTRLEGTRQSRRERSHWHSRRGAAGFVAQSGGIDSVEWQYRSRVDGADGGTMHCVGWLERKKTESRLTENHRSDGGFDVYAEL
jgi:hypothetical protein